LELTTMIRSALEQEPVPPETASGYRFAS
jgi:hypothetical protein